MIKYALMASTFLLFLEQCLLGVTCENGSRAVKAARALDKPRLERLYSDAEKVVLRIKDPPEFLGVHLDPVPEEFKDLNPILVRVHADSVLFRLEYCFDHHVDLVVQSIGSDQAVIEVQFGEGPDAGTAVLWRRDRV